MPTIPDNLDEEVDFKPLISPQSKNNQHVSLEAIQLERAAFYPLPKV
jgi:hypothetical protein